MAKVDASGGIRAMELWLLPFAAMFTRPSWLNAVALTSGALLCLNRRTVCAALRAVDGAADKGFSRFHRFLSCAQWSGLQGAKILLGLLQKAFVPDDEPLVIAVDDSVERRRGARIRDKGIWRDAVRSSRGFFVKTEGLRWLSLQVVVRPGFARRTWGLPFLTILSRSEQVDTRRQRRHQTLPEKAAWAMRLVARWCPGRRLVMVADGAYASLDVFWALRERAVCVARCRLDARFFNPPPPRKKGQKGRPRVRGTRQLTPRTRAVRKATEWVRMTIPGWQTKDGRTERAVDVATGTALWSAHGKTMPVRWVLDSGPDRARRDARVRLLRSRAISAADPDMVCEALGGRAHLPRDPAPSRLRDPTAVVGSGHPPDHAVAARSVLAGDAVGGQSGRKDRYARGARRCLVPQAGSDVRGLSRCCQTGAVGGGGGEPDPMAGRLSNLARTRTNRRKSQALGAASGRADVLRRLTSPKAPKSR